VLDLSVEFVLVFQRNRSSESLLDRGHCGDR
jgi:hypothetical protein